MIRKKVIRVIAALVDDEGLTKAGYEWLYDELGITKKELDEENE